MEKENELNLSPILNKGENTLVIRHDNATIIHEETPVRQTGIISAPSEFYLKRKGTDQFTKDNTLVTFSKKNLTIELLCRERDHFKDIITGKLVRHPFLKGLSINSENGYTIASLKKTFQFERRWFKDPAEHAALLKGLRNFTAKIDTILSETNDRNGQQAVSFEAKLQNADDFNISFTLKAPIFEGMDPVEIPITVEKEINNATKSVMFFLMYDDLDIVIDSVIDKAFEDQLTIFEEIVTIIKD